MPSSSVTLEKNPDESMEEESTAGSPDLLTYRHGVGADGNGLFRDGKIEFDHGWVSVPVGGPFALLLGMLGVEGHK